MKILQNKYQPLLIATIATLSILFFFSGPDYYSTRSFKAAWNLGHIAYFALLPLLIFHRPKTKSISYTTQIILIIAITLILGIIVELIQYKFKRTPDIGDLFRNLIGASIAIFFLLPTRKSIPNTALIGIKFVITALVTIQFFPIVIAIIDEHHARQQFPVLSDFQTPYQIHRWKGGASMSIEDTINPAGNSSMRVALTTQQYSGVNLKYFQGNWEQYNHFQFRIYNPSAESLSLTCRIHDAMHTQGPQKYEDRFNKTYLLTKGWNTISISLDDIQQAPESRQMDMRQIQGIGLFATRLPQPRVIYIDDLKLL